MEKNFYPGLKKILFPLQKARDLMDTSEPARVMFDRVPGMAVGKSGPKLVEFLKEISLFTGLARRELRQLARIVHERDYRDGEIIFEQGTPGAALYLVRTGTVEIARKKRNGEEIPMAVLEPPASFEELAVVGTEVVHWASARARGQVSLVAIGRSDLDTLSSNFPRLAIKVLRNLGEIITVQLQMLLEPELFQKNRGTDQ